MRPTLPLIPLLLLASACATTSSPETAPPVAEAPAEEIAAAQAAPPPGAADPADMMGPLSEEAFKALHVLRGDEGPPMDGQWVELAGGRAWLSLPEDASGPVPGIIVIHEWWGLTDHIKRWTDRLADAGYAAVAVDLYGGQVATNPDEAMSYMKAVDRDKALETLKAAHQLLVEDPRIMAPRTGVVGWCFGGGWSLQAALTLPELDAAVMYYGRVVTDPAALAPLEAELLGIFANRDQGIPPADVDAFDAALTEAGKAHRILRYDADHAFANPSGQRYDEASASAAWAEVQGFFQRELKASP